MAFFTDNEFIISLSFTAIFSKICGKGLKTFKSLLAFFFSYVKNIKPPMQQADHHQ